jgi:hypothetical protein
MMEFMDLVIYICEGNESAGNERAKKQIPLFV